MPSKAETRALHLMRKLHAATGGKPQHWEMLDNLSVVQADAAGIGYAVEMGWMVNRRGVPPPIGVPSY